MVFGLRVVKTCGIGMVLAVLIGESQAKSLQPVNSEVRLSYIRSAQVWQPTDIPRVDILKGPGDAARFGFEQRVNCDFVPKKPHGTTSKFFCRMEDGTKLKIRYDASNGKVFAMPAASRLFWALGFGAVRSYPVKVDCRGCSEDPWLDPPVDATEHHFFHPAVADLKMPGEEIIEADTGESGWDWSELDRVEERRGGAPRAHRDALKLLAAFVQHGDNNPGQQKLMCLPEGIHKDDFGNVICTKPFMMVEDLGSTFGGAEMLDERASMNLVAWASHSIWKDRSRCVADLAHTPFGSLTDPKISEKGRAFLASLLLQLSDRQIEDIFRMGRADRRDQSEQSRIMNADEDAAFRRINGVPISEWVRVFKAKREEIARARCP